MYSHLLKRIVQRLGYFMFVLGLASMIQPVMAQQALSVSISMFEDTHAVAAQEIIESPDSFPFVEVKNKRNFGLSDANYWFKIQIAPAEQAQQQMLEISYALLDVVDIYTHSDAGWSHLATGDERPVSNRETLHHHFLKALQSIPGESALVFLRVRSNGPIIVPIAVWEMSSFHQHDHKRTFQEGLYFGVLLALVLFNLFIYLSIRSRSYLYYVSYLSLITLFMLSVEGMMVTYISPSFPLINSRLAFVSLYLALIMAFKFTARINNTERISPGLVKIFDWVSLLLAIVLLVGVFLGVRVLTQLTPYVVLLSIMLYTHAIVLGIRAVYKPSYFVGFAYLMLLPGACLYVLRLLGLLDSGDWPEHALQAGVVLEALLLSLVLSYRIRYAQSRLEQVQRMAYLERQDFARKLIETRDGELKQLAMELHDGLGQNLMALKNKLGRILRQENNVPATSRAALEAEQIAQLTIDDIRRISHHLHPHILDRLGLKHAIIHIAIDTCEAETVEVLCEIDDINLDKNSATALHLYRIVQEAVKNCAVHANAVRVVIKLKDIQAQLQLSIEDFPAEAQELWLASLDFSQSFGLSNIQQRVALLKGSTDFSTNDAGGFRILITVPYPA